MSAELKCACGCGRTFERSGKRGQVRAYFSRSCRQRAYERRRGLPALPVRRVNSGLPPVEAVVVSSASVERQITRGLVEARSLGIAFENLGRVAPPELAWRCAQLGDGILSTMVATFGDGVA